MTYGVLKNIVTGLLVGDNVLPNDDAVVRGLVEYALITVATQADSMHLMTLDNTGNTLRIARGDYYIRVPNTPGVDDESVDIDRELVFAVARYIASYVSSNKGGIHVQAANRIILDFNSNVAALVESVTFDAVDDACVLGGEVL